MSDRPQYQVHRIAYMAILILVSTIFVWPFLIPVLIAGSVALTLYPSQVWLEKKGLRKKQSAALLTLFFTTVISIPFLFFVTRGTILVIEKLEKLAVSEKIAAEGFQTLVKTFRADLIDQIMGYASRFPLVGFLTEDKIGEYLQSLNLMLLNFFRNFASSIPMMILFLLVMIFCTYSFLKYAESIRGFFQTIFGFNERKMDQFVGIFLRDARQVYISNILTGAVQSTIVATTVYFVLEIDWFLVFFVTLILSFIPVIGAAPVAFIFAAVSFLQGHNSGAVVLLVAGSFTGIIDNFLRPWLASFGQTRAPPIVSFVCVIGGALLLGFPGLFLGLLVGSISYDTLPLFWDEITKDKTSRLLPSFLGGEKDKDKDDDDKLAQ